MDGAGGGGVGGSSGPHRCVDASLPPRPNAGTTLQVQLPTAEAVSSVAALSASCYEASFATTGLPVGEHTNTIVNTVWGGSRPFTLRLQPAPAAIAPVQLHVQSGFTGNLSAALEKARLAFSAC